MPTEVAVGIGGIGQTSGDQGGGGALAGPSAPPPWLPAGLVLLTAGLAGIAVVWSRRRRRNDPAIAMAAALPFPPAVVAPPGPPRRAVLEPVLAGGMADLSLSEASIPRWRRPSLREARFSQVDAKQNALRDRLAFEAPPNPDVERLVVRYDLVSLVATPEGGPAAAVEDLRSGDELDVISRRDGWVEARTAGGAIGWIPESIVKAIDSVRTASAVGSDEPAPAPPKRGAKSRRSPGRPAARRASGQGRPSQAARD